MPEARRFRERVEEASHAQLYAAAAIMLRHVDAQSLRNMLESAPLYLPEDALAQIKVKLTEPQ